MIGVFATVPCALSIAYRMPAYEGWPESSCAKILRSHVTEHDVWGYAMPKVVFFEGLTNQEVRDECSTVRKKVGKRLSVLEAATIRARYGLTDYVDIDGERRYVFSADRAGAIRALSEHLSSEFETLSETERDLLVSRVFANSRSTTPITLRAIAAICGRSHVHYHHYFHAIDDRLYHLEMRALDVLTEAFAERGECDGEPVVAAVEHYASNR